MNLDYLAKQFSKQLVELVNDCQLPPTLAYYVMKDVLDSISDQATKMCLQAEYELFGNKEFAATQEVPLTIVGKDKIEQEDNPKNKE